MTRIERESALKKMEDPNFCIHFFQHLMHYLDRQAGACYTSGAIKAAKAMDQATSMLRQASFRMALCEPEVDTDAIDTQYDKKARNLAQYCVNNKNTLARLLISLERQIVNKDESLHAYLRSAAVFVLFCNKVLKKTNEQKARQEENARARLAKAREALAATNEKAKRPG